MKNLSILTTAVFAASLLASANVAYAQGGGGFDYRAQAKEIALAVAAAKGGASTVATKNAAGATEIK